MNSVKSAALGSLAMARDVVSPEHLHTGLVVVAEKGKELVEAAPSAAEHVSQNAHVSSYYPLLSSFSEEGGGFPLCVMHSGYH